MNSEDISVMLERAEKAERIGDAVIISLAVFVISGLFTLATFGVASLL